MEVDKLLEQVKQESIADLTKGRKGRPATRQRRKQMIQEIRSGRSAVIDRGWLLEQLLNMYEAKGIRPLDRLRALELMSKVSGYGNRTEEPQDEKKAIAELMDELEQDAEPAQD